MLLFCSMTAVNFTMFYLLHTKVITSLYILHCVTSLCFLRCVHSLLCTCLFTRMGSTTTSSSFCTANICRSFTLFYFNIIALVNRSFSELTFCTSSTEIQENEIFSVQKMHTYVLFYLLDVILGILSQK